MATLQGQMGNVAKFSYAAEIKLDASAPLNPENIVSVTKTLQAAKQEKVKIDPEVVQMAGVKFITATKENENAWKAATSFMDYRSYLNQDYQPNLGRLHALENPQYYFTITVKSAPGSTTPYTHFVGEVLVSGSAGPESSARYEPINSTQKSSEVAFVLVNRSAR